jgi:hypothetical protein
VTLSRRRVLKLLAAGGSAAALEGVTGCADSTPSSEVDTADAGWGTDWICPGVANLRIENGEHVLEAGSDIFPNDPRPVAFRLDSRFVDGRIRATVAAAGREVGVVLRRTSPRDYYAAIYELDAGELRIVRRTGFDLVTLAATPALIAPLPATLELEASGTSPTQLTARLGTVELSAQDATTDLQRAGDPGVLTRADTLLPDTNPILPALGNLHLLPYSVQEGQVVIGTPLGQQFIETIRRRSTARFSQISVESLETFASTPPSVIAATTGAPLDGGAILHVASDVPATIEIEIGTSPEFEDSTQIDAGATDDFDAVALPVRGLPPGTVHWRARLRRNGLETIGPSRQFRVIGPQGGVTLVHGACASQFNAIFDHIAAHQPDVFLWDGDLNYADTHGPFAQTLAGYAGIWRHFLDNPRLAPILQRASFVAGRDDHDYGLQDANSTNLVPWGLAPWESLMNPAIYQKLSLGLVDVWRVDQRMFKSDPALPDTIDKSLLGSTQRQWLFDGLAASTAPFKVICSPCTLAPAPGANARDGSWTTGFTAERDALLAHIRENVDGQVIFLTGDTHFTFVWDREGLFEQRACPLDIPLPNDQSISNPSLELTYANVEGVAYWSRRGHFSSLRAAIEDGRATLTVELVRDDGVVVHRRAFEAIAPTT